MAGKPIKDGPAYVSNSAADLYDVPSGQILRLRHIHLVNKSASAATVSIYIGLTGGSAGGTEILDDYSIAAGDVYDLYFPAGVPLADTDFISAVASAASAIVATISGELEVA